MQKPKKKRKKQPKVNLLGFDLAGGWLLQFLNWKSYLGLNEKKWEETYTLTLTKLKAANVLYVIDLNVTHAALDILRRPHQALFLAVV